MTVTLELKPSVEATAKAEAQAQGIAVEKYLQASLEQTLPHPQDRNLETIRQQRIETLVRLQGKYAGLPGGSEGFAAQKKEEKAREERHWQGKT